MTKLSELKALAEIAKKLCMEATTEEEAYNMGDDAEVSGPNEMNCGIRLFSSPQLTHAWERGNMEAKEA